MTVYVDALRDWGWVMYGRTIQSCHMFTNSSDLQELHAMAANIGLKRRYFQDSSDHPHYDLTGSRRAAAIRMGAIEATSRDWVRMIRAQNTQKESASQDH